MLEAVRFTLKTGLFIFGIMLIGITFMLVVPTVNTLIENNTIHEIWLDVALVSPLIALTLLMYQYAKKGWNEIFTSIWRKLND